MTMMIILEIGGGWEKQSNEGERRFGDGIRKRKLKRRRENWTGGKGGGEEGGDFTGIQLNKNIDVIDVPDLEEMIQLNRTLFL